MPSPPPSNTKPIIVIVHGAFHPPIYYRKLIEPLRAQGYTVLAPALPTTGLDDSVAGTTYVDDVRRIYESLLPLLDEEGREAVVVGHSQGGIAASAATEGQTVAERKARGLGGGIKAVVYIAAVALPERGLSLLGSMGLSEENLPPNTYRAEGPHYVPILPAEKKGVVPLYNMLPEEEQWRAAEGIVYQSRASLSAPVHFVAADVTVPKTYIVCTQDMAAAPQFQKAWAEASGCRAVEIESDHSPFMDAGRAKQVIDIIVDVAEN